MVKKCVTGKLCDHFANVLHKVNLRLVNNQATAKNFALTKKFTTPSLTVFQSIYSVVLNKRAAHLFIFDNFS